MKISHKIINSNGKENIYIYITVEDIYEFGRENLDNGDDTNFLNKLKKYIKDNFSNKLFSSSAFIVINGILIGSLSLASLYSSSKETTPNKPNIVESIYSEITTIPSDIKPYIEENTLQKEDETIEKVSEKEATPIVKESASKNNKSTKTNKKENTKTSKKTSSKKQTTSNTAKPSTTTTNKNKNNNLAATNKKTAATAPTKKPTSSNTTTTTTKESTTPSTTTQTNTTTNKNNNTQVIPSAYTIKLNNNGEVLTLGLEDYILGVVAAEMPASFNIEALKAQAVVARTYAMKKASKGITLQNSTYHQVYNTEKQLKNKWGSSFNTYYNKVKNAVSATKGEVLKYNGTYIEALYFSMSNGKTELPSYVWTTDYPYLKVVSSPWDENISGSKHTMTFNYNTLTEKLGVTVNKNSDIIILSKTPGNRINEISIAGKVFKGTKLKALLGLRSTDFNITKTDTGFKITTVGFGHGVGMSQYGANGAAKSGMTYKQILNHYYSGASLVKI